jgi:5-carboxymethyl-2-hydroxymuconate isomerase
MSHLTLEYSGNLRQGAGFADLCAKLAQFMTALEVDGSSVFPPGGVRVRAIPCEDYCIADGSLSDAAFVHAVLKIGAGRSDAAKQATCTGLFDIMKAHFADAYAHRGLALSLELNEFSEAGTLKHNNLHARFRRT